MIDVVDQYPKPRNLLYLLERENPESAIIFCNTRTDTELIANVLNRHGLDAEMLNGDLPQKERERVMGRIKKGELRFMVATDLAARGIDISDLTHVINYSLPEDPAVYLHRVGRTGRIGKKGTAMSLVTGAEIMTLSVLQKKFGINFRSMSLPTPEEAKSLWTERSVKELRDAMSTGAAFPRPTCPLAKDLAGHRKSATRCSPMRSSTSSRTTGWSVRRHGWSAKRRSSTRRRITRTPHAYGTATETPTRKPSLFGRRRQRASSASAEAVKRKAAAVAQRARARAARRPQGATERPPRREASSQSRTERA